MAHTTALAVARDEVLERAGWSVGEEGLQGGPRLRIVAGEKRHVTVDRALRLLGIGAGQVSLVPIDDQGRLRAERLPGMLAERDGPTIVVAQAGEVNTGSFDDFHAIADACETTGAWLHVDGAFGLWAGASDGLRHLVDGVDRADSWATDGHKWLNVPYDCGIALCADPAAHRRAMSATAAYLIQVDDAEGREPMAYTPEFSRRARAVPVYAAIRALGRDGVAALVERLLRARARLRGAHRRARRVRGAERGRPEPGALPLRGRRDDDARRWRRCRPGGEAWMSGTTWDGRPAIRLSVSGWRTTGDDIERTVSAFAQALARRELQVSD